MREISHSQISIMFERLILYMKAIFNSRIIDSSEYLIKTSDRSFCYGDGLFETIVTGHQRINLIDAHLSRLEKGCKVLGLDFPQQLSAIALKKMINQLVEMNGLNGDIRSKLIVWRNKGGLYTPTQSLSSFHLTVKSNSSNLFEKIKKTGFSENIHTHFSPISFAKTTNSLIYVLAGLEKLKKGLDDIILTDANGYLAETHTSNLFWVIKGSVFTPKIDSGCIEGVLRNELISLFTHFNMPIEEVNMPKEALVDAEYIFSTNASGIRYLSNVDGKDYENPEAFLKPIIKRLQQP